MQMGMLSVIVPVYNVEKYVEKCIKSIISQTYSNLEIILVDDGSTDKSGEICDEYAKKDNRIKVIHKENQGQSIARNVGMTLATGEFIAFVDSDDSLIENMYEVLLGLIITTNADIVSCGVNLVDEEHHIINSKNWSRNIVVLNREQIICGLYDSKFVRFEVWNKIFRKSILSGCTFTPRQIYEEVNFCRQIFQKVNKYVYYDLAFYNYLVKRPGNTRSFFSTKKLDVFDEFDKFIDDLRNNSYEKETVLKFQAIKVRFLLTQIYSAKTLKSEKKDRKYLISLFKKEYKKNANNPYIPRLASIVCNISPTIYVLLSSIKSAFRKQAIQD